MNRFFAQLLLIMLVISLTTMPINVRPARSASTIVVPDDYPTIQTAIDHAVDGDTIYIKAGVYYEQLYTNKSLSFVGEDADKTIVDGNNIGAALHALQVYGLGIISVENLTFQNGIDWGVMLEGYSGVFKGNIIRKSGDWAGLVWFPPGGTVLVENNTFSENHLGMEIEVEDTSVTLKNNRFVDNTYSFALDRVLDWHGVASLSLDTSNTVDGYPMYYFDGLDNQTIDEVRCPSAGYVGITRSNNVTVENLTLMEKNFDALLLYNVNNFTVTNVTCGESYDGINVNSCTNGTIVNSTFERNTVGLNLGYSEQVNVKGNIFENNSRCISPRGYLDQLLTYEIDASNSVDGGTAYYLKNVTDVVLDDFSIPNAGFLGIIDSNNVSVKNLNAIPSLAVTVAFSNSITITNVSAGSLFLYNVNSSEVTRNRLTGSQRGRAMDMVAILGLYVLNSTFDGNHISQFDFGLVILAGSDIILLENTILECNHALYFHCNGTLYHNSFVDNKQTVYSYYYSSARIIHWDNGYPSGGNYWSDENRTDMYQGPYQNETGSDGIADTPYFYGNWTLDRYPLMGPWTVQGENVTVTPSKTVAVTFGNTTSEGITFVNTNSSGPDPPSGFKLESASPQYYQINTTANYEGPITISISYDDAELTTEEEGALRLMHWNTTASEWTDITTSVDTTNNVVYGVTDHLSIFAVVWTVPSVDMRVRKVDSKSIVGNGYVLSVNVTVENQGYLETVFNVNLYANDSVVASSSGVDLQGGVTVTTNCAWNTSGYGYGNYTLEGYIPLVLNETDVSDNNCTLGYPVHVGVPGDVSSSVPGVYDMKCDMKDVAYLVILFNTKPASPNWNPNADVNNDGKANMIDIAIAILNFNQHE